MLFLTQMQPHKILTYRRDTKKDLAFYSPCFIVTSSESPNLFSKC